MTVDDLAERLASRGYLADRPLATVLSVALKLRRPLLLEGEAGVGKTEVAKTLADILGARLIRLQCHEGIDAGHALYDWNYQRQMLQIRLMEANGADAGSVVDLFGPEFLVRRPLLDAIDNDDAVAPVLLIDEIDRADDEFEALLLELLADFQVTIPELGTIKARVPPVVLLTSNRTRELHDALKRRCLYHWIGYPDVEREIGILRARAPEVPERLARQAAAFVARLRKAELIKAPGIAETLDWVNALASLGEHELEAGAASATLGVVLKHRDDLEAMPPGAVEALVRSARDDVQRLPGE
jgi:MoxR-like ATPase